jgi:mRNA interferase MazF
MGDMNRGELWTVAGGVYASKPRPALIIQDDHFGETDSVTVLPLSATLIDAPLVRIRVPATATTGIRTDSFAMVDKVTTVRRSNVQQRVGRVSAATLVEIERALLTFLGMAD